MLFDTTLRRELSRSFGATLVVILTIVLTMIPDPHRGPGGQGPGGAAGRGAAAGLRDLGYMPTVLALSLFVAVV
jgi:lipopolysaccharide export system permease protein